MLTAIADRIVAGERLSDEDARELLASADLITLGLLGEEAARARHGDEVTFVRVGDAAKEADRHDAANAGEWRITLAPSMLDEALAAVRDLVAIAAPVTAFDLADLALLATPLPTTLRALRDAGLPQIARASIDRLADAHAALGVAADEGLAVHSLTIANPGGDPVKAARLADELGARFGHLKAFAPLPLRESPTEPTTGYDDVRAIAVSRLIVRSIPSIQVDWRRYGPKLAQVSLLYGADDLDDVPVASDATLGVRRAPFEELVRNIRAASRVPVERNARFEVVA